MDLSDRGTRVHLNSKSDDLYISKPVVGRGAKMVGADHGGFE